MVFSISVFLFCSYYRQWLSIGIRYQWFLFFLWPWLHKWLHCNEKLLVNIRVWWVQCCVSWNLLTWHQEFATYEGMKGWWDTWRINFWGAFLKRCFNNEQKWAMTHFIHWLKLWVNLLRENILFETKVAMALEHLGTGIF